MAKAFCVKYAAKVAFESRFWRLDMEGDCLSLIQALYREDVPFFNSFYYVST